MFYLYNTSYFAYLLSFAAKESNKENLFCFFTFSLCNTRCSYSACATTSAALRLRRPFCSGLYEAFKGGFAAIPMGMDIPGFAARLIAPVLRVCDTKFFVSLTSSTLVHRPAAFAGYPPLPCAVGLFLNFLILFHSLFFQIPIINIISFPSII